MKNVQIITVCLVLSVGLNIKVHAQTSSSSSYSIEESSFGSGSGSGTSASYSARGSAGDLGTGSANSTSYRAYAGPISPNEEYLEMVVTAATIDLGTLSDSATSFGVGTFYVRSYLNSSYSVATLSQTLTSEGNATIQPMTATAVSAIGTEQFGINLVDNATPNVGANPAPQPGSAFANGQAAAGYGTVDQFRYNQGETIAQNGGNPAWGQTNFTISYIVNINGNTEAGFYQMVHVLVAVPSF